MRRLTAASVLVALAFPAFSFPAFAGTTVRMDGASPDTSIFPSDRWTRPDWTQRTFRRVELPKPDCAVRVTDCQDIAVINTLDGFNVQPRISVPFDGDIDPASVSSETVYLVNLGDTLTLRGLGQRVGINQVQWKPATKTLVFESDEQLAEHSRYVVVVTDGVKDAAGKPVDAGAFGRWLSSPTVAQWRDLALASYRKELLDAERAVLPRGRKIVGLSLFTTRSVSADLEKIRARIQGADPGRIDFMVGNGGATRAVFPLAGLTGIEFRRQTGAAPTFTTSNLPLSALGVVPGSIDRIAFGTFRAAEWREADMVIPPTGTLLGQPQPQGVNTLTVEVFLPSGPRPAAGWPVAIFGHGFTDSMYGAPWTVASTLASQGIATVAINVPGHGGGALGTLNVVPTSGAPVVIPAGGRGFDQDGNGTIDSTEGSSAAGPRAIVSSRDSLRQTVADLMQLVRQVQLGVDVDGDGSRDLDANRIYYAGQSFGGIYGTIFLGMEGDVRAGVPNVPGGAVSEVARLGGFRVLTAASLATRVPQLLNLPPLPNVPVPANLVFNENVPLRDQPVSIDTVPGATAIQTVLENNEWVQQSGNPVAYASLIRKQPLRGNAPKPVILQFAKGDQTVPNPTTTAIIRAGALQDRTLYYRHDLAYAATGGAIPKNPHTFLTNIAVPAAAPFAIAAQRQIAAFFASNGTLVVDPDGAGPIFEMPIAEPLPEGLNYIP